MIRAWPEATGGTRPGQRVQPVAPEMLINIDGFAPAGAISSTALDMTRWLRFLLRQGVQDGKALIKLVLLPWRRRGRRRFRSAAAWATAWAGWCAPGRDSG